MRDAKEVAKELRKLAALAKAAFDRDSWQTLKDAAEILEQKG